LVDTFVRQFDGKIDFKSTTGNTTFTITLQPYP
jgi:nitrogen-specific signal transduction histidine kinase